MSRVPFVHVDHPLGALDVGATVHLTERDRHHLHRVLRLSDGAAVELADGAGVTADAELTADGAVLAAAPTRHPPPRPRLEVAQALAKGGRVDEVVRAVTELGVDAILPVLASRSVSRPDGARVARVTQRWRDVARAACEQARRPWRPDVTDVHRPDALADRDVALLVAHPGGAPLPDGLDRLRSAAVIRVAVGPEGGWSDDEVAALVGGGGQLVGLGPTVLRTEHAAVVALAVLAAGLGRWTELDGP